MSGLSSPWNRPAAISLPPLDVCNDSKTLELLLETDLFTVCLGCVHDGKDGRTEMRMIRWMCGDSFRGDRTVKTQLGVEAIGDVMRRCRLMWHGHLERTEDAGYVKACTRLKLS